MLSMVKLSADQTVESLSTFSVMIKSSLALSGNRRFLYWSGCLPYWWSTLCHWQAI